MSKFLKPLPLFLIITLLLISCNKEYFELDKISEVLYSPTLAIPVANAEYSINDLINKLDSNVQISQNKEGILEFIYQDSLGPVVFADQVVLESQEYQSTLDLEITEPLTLPIGDFITTTLKKNDFPFLVEKNERLDSAFLKSTPIRITAQSFIPGNIRFFLKLNSMLDKDGNAIEIEMPMDFEGNLPFQRVNEFNADGVKLDLTSGGTSFNIFSMEAYMQVVSTGVIFTPSDLFYFTIEVINPGFYSAFGYLGNYKIEVDPFNVDLGYNKYTNQGSVRFEKPFLKLELNTNAGLSAALDIDINFITPEDLGLILEGNILDNDIIINGPDISQFGEYVTSSITFEPQNSNLFDILSRNPKSMYTGISLVINPENDTTRKNFVTDSSHIIPEYELNLPLSLSVYELRGGSSLLLDIPDFDMTNFGFLNLKIRSENEIPIGGKLSLKFMDEEGKVLEDVFNGFVGIIPPGQTDDLGFSIQSVTDSVEIVLSRPVLENILDSYRVLIEAELNTDDSEILKYVKLTGREKLKIDIGILGQLEYNQ